jgi:hypothetical protein
MPIKIPPHPGGFVLRQSIEPSGLSITDAAATLGVRGTTLSELVNGKRGISLKWRCASPGSSAAVLPRVSRNKRTTIWRKCTLTAVSSSDWNSYRRSNRYRNPV